MRARRARRFVFERRRTVILPGLLLLTALASWLLLEYRPFRPAPGSFNARLESSRMALVDHRDRTELDLRLHLLETALLDGRRSAELRPDYRIVENQLERVLAREESGLRGELEAEAAALLSDLTRDRGAARERILRLQEELRQPAGLGRQGDGE